MLTYEIRKDTHAIHIRVPGEPGNEASTRLGLACETRTGVALERGYSGSTLTKLLIDVVEQPLFTAFSSIPDYTVRL